MRRQRISKRKNLNTYKCVNCGREVDTDTKKKVKCKECKYRMEQIKEDGFISTNISNQQTKETLVKPLKTRNSYGVDGGWKPNISGDIDKTFLSVDGKRIYAKLMGRYP